jgi:hypothetical protein
VGITVFDAGTFSQLTDSVFFTGVTVLGIRKTFTVNGNISNEPSNTGGSVSINGETARSFFAPEPGTIGLAALVLAALLARAWQRRPSSGS